ncbi:hypothetical protein LZC95_18210 [Pendulispora brunnea]|uniref:Uncharacterized protein n=1 Tax=Pendulispora brunnea TaxID=2905690 RepID=A0ABZ2KQY3_9BACT
MADESKVEARENPIPAPLADDHEDVSWALSTAKTTWDRGEHTDALKWLRRAAEAASEAEADDRALALAKAAADLTTRIDELGWEIGSSVRPPPTPQGGGGTFPKATVRLSPLVPPAPPPSQQPVRPAVPLPPPAPSPRALRPSAPQERSPAPPTASSGSTRTSTPSGASPAPPKTLPTPPRSATGAALLNNAAGKSARPKHPSLGLLGPRPRISDATPPPLPPRASQSPRVPSKPPPAPARAPTPPPPPPRVEAPAVIEAISSKNLVSVSAIPGSSPRQESLPDRPSSGTTSTTQPISAEPFPLASKHDTPAAPPPQMDASSEVSQVIVSQNLAGREGQRTTRPAGAWDDSSTSSISSQEDVSFASTQVYPSGPESITFVAPGARPDTSQVMETPTAAPPAVESDSHLTSPPASSQAIENILRNTNFGSPEDIESWPTEAVAGNELPNFSFDDATKTRIGTPAYSEEVLAASPDETVAAADTQPRGSRPNLEQEPRASRPSYTNESRIAARGPVQKPSQAVRVVVWRDPDGVHVAPHGTTVTAISVDALLVALDPSADLFAWLTNK